MWFKTITLVICLLVQSCSLSFNGWGRRPSSVASFEELQTRMQKYKERLIGSEQDATCSKEQLDEDFKKLMASVKHNSCSEDNFVFDREEFDQKACPKIKKEGYFDKIIKRTIAEEKDKKRVTIFQDKVDPTFIALYKEAQGFLREVNVPVIDEQYETGPRAELLASYVENVLLPVRDVIVAMRSYLPKEDDGKIFYITLQPYVTPEFLNKLKPDERGLITQGPNPGASPFYMSVYRTADQLLQLQFNPAEIIRRDVITLLKAPTAKNYTLALKWMTLHMMLSQASLYEALAGGDEAVRIPNSCQNHFNGNLPSSFKYNFDDGESEQFLEKILLGSGLTFKEGDDSYYNYYYENVNSDPTKNGYSGLAPFENYRNALRSSESKGAQALEPQFDDVSHFDSVLSSKSEEAQRVFKGKLKGRTINYPGLETFKKFLGSFEENQIQEIKLANGEISRIYAGKQNLSPYLLELMQKNGFTDYSDLITEKLKKKFVGKTVSLEFPSLYSSPVWRSWSLKYLSETIHKYEDQPTSSKIYQLIVNACNLNGRRNEELKKICFSGNPLVNVSNLLSEFRGGDKYVPTKRLETQRFKELYPFLGYLWSSFRDYLNILPEAKPFELNFLKDQMAAGNPWARLKLSYMIALDQLEYEQEGIIPKYDTKIFYSKANEEVMCKITNSSLIYNKIEEAGKVLGLDKPLTYNFIGTILDRKEKDEIWKTILDDIQQRNAQLFTVKTKNKTNYQILEDINDKTILTEGAALSTGYPISNTATTEIKKVTQSTEAKLSQFFLKLYELRDPEKQKILFEEFSKVNGMDQDFKLKMSFLSLDNSYKKPIYKDLLKQAALTRKLQIMVELDKFCKMDVNDEVQFKNIFYSTTKSQNDLNKLAGLPGVPSEVMSKINEMTASEWRDMWWGIGSAVAGITAVVIGGACTTFTGGICAPLGGVMAVAGLSSIGIQMNVASNELERTAQANISGKQIQIMEELGFSKTGSSEEVSRSYAMAAFEVISIFPLIGVATRSLSLGPKLAYVSAKSIMRQTGATAFKAAAKSAIAQEEVRAAEYLLDLTSVVKNLGLDSKTLDGIKTKIGKIKKLYVSGQIDMDTMLARVSETLAPVQRAKLAMARSIKGEFGSITVKYGPEKVDRKTATIISNYFSDNPREMLRLIEGYSGERLNEAVRVMKEVNAVDRIDNRYPIFGGMKDWYLKMRNDKLAENASKILRIEKELTQLGTKPGQLEDFVFKNIDDITDIFIDIPLKKREIPYFIFVQGMPEFNFIKGAKIPILSSMSQGQTLRRLVLARARLVHESYKSQARRALGLTKRYVQSETTYDVFSLFKKSVAELANSKTGKESAKIMGEYRDLEEKVARKLHAKYKADGEKMEFKKFKRLLMNPANTEERATAEALWESVPADELMGMKEVGEFAHKAVKELSQYNNIDSFERYLGALKVLIINRNPAVLEIM